MPTSQRNLSQSCMNRTNSINGLLFFRTQLRQKSDHRDCPVKTERQRKHSNVRREIYSRTAKNDSTCMKEYQTI